MNALPVTTAIGAQMVIRPAEAGDTAFIRDSWKRSYLEGGFAPRCERLLYWEGQSDLINRLMGRSETLVAANSEDQAQLFGWVCFERTGRVGIVHFACVKRTFRQMGIGRALVLASVSSCEGRYHSHRTKLGELAARRIDSTWNPYLLGGIG